MRQSHSFVLAALLLPVAAGADILGVTVGANYWNYDISGTARYQTKDSSNDIDVNKDLGYDDGNLGYYYIELEHPVPLLPNIRVSKTNVDEDANGTLSKTVIYGGTTFQANENVSSEVQLDQTDITLYYSPLDTVVNLDFGLNAKYIDSKARITGAISGTQTADVSGWVPMAYVGVGIDLPLTGLAVSADGSFVKYQSSSFYDYTLRVTYTSPWYVGADVGYRKIKLDLDDFDDSFANIEFDGPYAGLYLHF
ncbi:MAG: TIGR04219 family outer membrane beta-barrel protein [Gammaproteobacteria bacterium]|nr:MAG: TIGR04219 family outer membrane beta-barrel protein [Gammaproteobacteria bacterium]